LESVKSIIGYLVIADTGSTDGTQNIIKELLRDIPGELYERPRVDFSHNRNEALHYALGKSDYLVFIDADDYFDRENCI
jgi:glycosyltransferase involved in cell wall biosynthesis